MPEDVAKLYKCVFKESQLMYFSRDLSAWQMNLQRAVSAQGTLCPLPAPRPGQDCPQRAGRSPAGRTVPVGQRHWTLPAPGAACGQGVGLRQQGKGTLDYKLVRIKLG